VGANTVRIFPESETNSSSPTFERRSTSWLKPAAVATSAIFLVADVGKRTLLITCTTPLSATESGRVTIALLLIVMIPPFTSVKMVFPFMVSTVLSSTMSEEEIVMSSTT